jgi:hypothetical protein
LFPAILPRDDRLDLNRELRVLEGHTPHPDHLPEPCRTPEIVRRLMDWAIRRHQPVREVEVSVPHLDSTPVHRTQVFMS